MFTNRFAGVCFNSSCRTKVAAQAGYTEKTNKGWVVWCSNCVPTKKAEVAGPRRMLGEDGMIIMPYEPQNLDLIRAMPGAKWQPKEKKWAVSLKPADRMRVLELADRIGLEVAPALRNIMMSEQAQNANTMGLYPYQVAGVNFLSQKDRAILGDEMGLGKTVQSLMSIPSDGSTLVICRAGLKYNWLDEVQKWRKDLTPVVLSGRNNFRWPKIGEVVIINNDILPNSFNAPKKLQNETKEAYWARLAEYREKLAETNLKAHQTIVIVDEAHDYKNSKAARSRKVREICRMARKVIALTGSPLANRPEDLFGVFDTLGVAKEVFGSFNKFQQVFNASYDSFRSHGQTINKIVYGKPKPIVPELLRRVMLRRKREEVLPDLPNKTYTNLMVGDMDASLEKKLDNMWDEWGTCVEVAKELPPFERFSEIRAELAKSRVPAMLEYVENCEEQEVPLVVFSAHLAPLDAFLGRPGWAVISGCTSSERRQEIVRAFQAGKLKGVAVSIKAGGVGINLTHAWKALFVDLDWTPSSNWQAEDRLARIGQKSDKVEIVRMVSNHPLDIHVQNLLCEKIDTCIRAIDSVVQGEKLHTNSIPTETQEEFEARMQMIREKQEAFEQMQKAEMEANQKAFAKNKMKGIYEREKAKAKEVLPLTPERIQVVKDAFKFMLSVCDGAMMRDNNGFNRPDAAVGHWVLSAGLENEQEVLAAYFMLSRYSRQLKHQFPKLFKD